MSELNFNSFVEDPAKLKALTRRVFLGVVGGVATQHLYRKRYPQRGRLGRRPRLDAHHG